MSSKTELSDLIIKAYAHQKNGESSKAVTVWNNLLNHQFSDKDLKDNVHLNLSNCYNQLNQTTRGN